jgi:hypothetical protein
MKQAGVLAGLLVLAVGSGAVAQSTSPHVSPGWNSPDGPEGIASYLPSHVGAVELEDFTAPQGRIMAGWLVEAMQREAGQTVTEPEDVEVAMAWTGDPPQDAARLWVTAMRAEGVQTEPIAEPFMHLFLEAVGGQPEPIPAEWREVDGRDVLVWPWPPFEDGSWLAAYPYDEVLFFVTKAGAESVTLETVLAELP